MDTQNRLGTLDVRRADLDDLLVRPVGAGDASALAEHIDPGASSICSVCGSAVAEDDIENTNGWRWYSDGRGGLRTLCATCPAPTSLSSYYE